MNMSDVIQQLITSYGLYGITLPYKDENGKPKPTETVIHELLTNVTIPIYSDFVPWIRECDTNIADLEVVDRKNSIYKLPHFLTLTPVKYVIDVSLPFQNTRGTYGDIAPAYGINRSVQGVVTSQAYMMLAGQMRAEPTFDYLGNNKIRLYGYPRTVLTFKVACTHDPSGETIEDGCRDSFMELAELDLEMFLYNSLKLYDGLPTAFGNINLKIDDYQSAKADRKALLNEWRDRFHLDMGWEEFM